MKLFTSAVILALNFVSMGWAQTGKSMPFAQLAAYDKPDREQILYAGAKTEGKITWYTSLAGGSYKELAAAFEAKYPGVKVEAYRATRQELGARILAEAQAKRYIVDTIETTIPLLKVLKDNKLIVAYYFPTHAKYPD